MALIEPQNPIKPHNLKFFTGDEYELAINQSIQSLLDSLQNPNPDLSGFASKFLELMQVKSNPHPETIWILSSFTFQIDSSRKDDILDQVLVVKDLFQSITTCSASSSASVCIALIAPVIYKLYSVVIDLKRKEGDLKRGKKARREIRSFVDVILGYFNVCCEGSNNDEEAGLIRPLNDLISIWVHSEGTEKGSKQFFPLLSDEIVHWVTEESRVNLGLLAGAVIVEAFLLKLCLKFNDGSSKQELQNELRTWAVCSITGFHNFYIFDMLVKLLLEPNLPVMSLLSSEDESFLRKVLYDVILPDFSFLRLDKVGHIPNSHIKNNVVARLMVTHEAIELLRKNKDYTEAISYTNAFSGSHLPTLITKLVTSEIGTNGNATQPKGSSPMAFIKWMLDLEDQGLNLTDGFISKHRARLVHYRSSLDLDPQSSKLNAAGKNDDDLGFFIDNKGNDEEEKIDDSMNDVFVAAARSMQSGTNESGKKRKETHFGKKKGGVKFQRYNLVDHSGSKSGKKTGLLEKDDSSSDSEVEDPDSDEDLE
ncbi:hypothetical protein L1987_59782 [Smallanthus sonchifolius]|uniref:Uncharacterized protein n=1 Tax=Smallanthus sonchifolius TaxID=185202 RepID=A0ACB9D6A3_9ASTR|nr:hypothetical protein L1987_59782 [Smallanthus sonchifolius]